MTLTGRSAALSVFLLAAFAAVTAVFGMGADRKLEADAPYYWSIAQSLGQGQGFVNNVGPWAGKPTAERLPIWPMLLAPFTLISSNPVAARLATALFHPISALCLFWLTRRLCGGTVLPAFGAGVLAAISPPSLLLVTLAMSEVVAVLLLTLGAWLLVSEKPIWGAFVLSLAAMTRANLLILPVAALLAALCFRSFRCGFAANWRMYAAAIAAFAILPFFWLTRSYVHFGHFFYISGMEGETFYGANNSVVANDLAQWGYWVIPDAVPGETPKLALAKLTGNEWEMNEYYLQKGRAFVLTNLPAMPRLVLGKLVRGYVPIPWNPTLTSFLGFLFRGALDVGILATAALWWRRTDERFLVLLGALFLVNLATTVVYYGSSRFTYASIEFISIPLLGVALHAVRNPEPADREKALIANAGR